MIAKGRGLIVNISFWAAQKHIGNVAYGVSKAATDKMTADMANELTPHGVAVVSLYPGLVRTEKVMEAAQWLDLTNSESPEFIGRAVAALAADPEVIRHTGKVLVAAALAQEYGFTDIDGKAPRPLTIADDEELRHPTTERCHPLVLANCSEAHAEAGEQPRSLRVFVSPAPVIG